MLGQTHAAGPVWAERACRLSGLSPFGSVPTVKFGASSDAKHKPTVAGCVARQRGNDVQWRRRASTPTRSAIGTCALDRERRQDARRVAAAAALLRIPRPRFGARSSQGGVPVSTAAADCERVAFITKCRKAGVTLSRHHRDHRGDRRRRSRRSLFKAGQETCMALVERLERRRRVLDEALAELSHVYALLTTRLLGEA